MNTIDQPFHMVPLDQLFSHLCSTIWILFVTIERGTVTSSLKSVLVVLTVVPYSRMKTNIVVSFYFLSPVLISPFSSSSLALSYCIAYQTRARAHTHTSSSPSAPTVRNELYDHCCYAPFHSSWFFPILHKKCFVVIGVADLYASEIDRAWVCVCCMFIC